MRGSAAHSWDKTHINKGIDRINVRQGGGFRWGRHLTCREGQAQQSDNTKCAMKEVILVEVGAGGSPKRSQAVPCVAEEICQQRQRNSLELFPV